MPTPCTNKSGVAGYVAKSKKGKNFCRAGTKGTRRIRKDKGTKRGIRDHTKIGVYRGRAVYKNVGGKGVFYFNSSGKKSYIPVKRGRHIEATY